MKKTSRNPLIVRQGDVLLRQVKTIPATAVAQKQGGPIILALGEATGHKHQIADGENVDVFVTAEGAMYLEVKTPATLRHEEHASITLPTGKYERVVQVEYSPEEIRNVAD